MKLSNPVGNDQFFNIYSNDTSRFSLRLRNGYIGLLGITNPTSPLHIQITDNPVIAQDIIYFQQAGTASAFIKFGEGSIANSETRIGKNANGIVGISSTASPTSGIFFNPATSRVGVNKQFPDKAFHVSGEVRIDDVDNGTPTKIIGANASGDIGTVTIGSGLTLTSGTLSASGITAVTGYAASAQNATTISINVTQLPSYIFRYLNNTAVTVTNVSISNPVSGGTYTLHLQNSLDVSKQVTIQWPTTFKDLAGNNYGTRYYNSPTIITCYYDGTNFNCN